MTGKCAHCPLAGAERACKAHTLRHPRYCRLVDPDDPVYHPAYRELLLADAGGRPGPAVRPSVDESLILLNRMKACPHRTGEAGCGCGGLARCDLGRGRDGLVNDGDCFACLREQAG